MLPGAAERSRIMSPRAVRSALVCACLAISTACATTSLLTSWVDPQASGTRLGKVMILGVASNPVVRRQYEDTFAAELASKKIGAVPSYQFLPDAKAVTEASLAPLVVQHHVTHVLVTRLVDRKTVTTYVPPTTTTIATGYPSYYPAYYGSWYGYYNTGYTTVSSPGYTYDTEFVNLETNVYDVQSGKLVWSGLTETELGNKVQAQIQEFIQVITTAMSRDQLI
jgi:hypothetical protein